MKIFVNALTLTRLFITFILPFLWKVLDPIVLMTLIMLILLTDFFDGFLARKFKVQTLFGLLFDTFADKTFGIMILILIGAYIKEYYLIVIAELVIAAINVLAGFKGATVKSSFLGKTKMWVLGLSTMLGLCYIFKDDLTKIDFFKNVIHYMIDNRENIISGSIFITFGSELMVIIDYLKTIHKELKNKKNKLEYNFKKGKDLKYVLFNTDYFIKNKDVPMSKHLLY